MESTPGENKSTQMYTHVRFRWCIHPKIHTNLDTSVYLNGSTAFRELREKSVNKRESRLRRLLLILKGISCIVQAVVRAVVEKAIAVKGTLQYEVVPLLVKMVQVKIANPLD